MLLFLLPSCGLYRFVASALSRRSAARATRRWQTVRKSSDDRGNQAQVVSKGSGISETCAA